MLQRRSLRIAVLQRAREHGLDGDGTGLDRRNSARIQKPGEGDRFNPFIKFSGLELFGDIEQAKGRAATELTDRTWSAECRRSRVSILLTSCYT